MDKSALIVNNDGSIYHLHLRPEDISDTIILVGNPARVDMISCFFDTIRICKRNREFYSKTGYYRNHLFTVMSTGIGTDNIDIAVNELDALVNIDLQNGIPKKSIKSLQFIRIGTSGALQPDIPVNTFLLSEKSIGFDGIINFYANREKITDHDFEMAFMKHTGWNDKLATPYVVDASNELLEKLYNPHMMKGVTISTNGFYGPQGRVLRLPIADTGLNNKIARFRYRNYRITNFEMESSALFGLAKLLGHQAACICLIIANRITKQVNKDYKPYMEKMIQSVLDSLVG